jgi:hypothetical protein
MAVRFPHGQNTARAGSDLAIETGPDRAIQVRHALDVFAEEFPAGLGDDDFADQ